MQKNLIIETAWDCHIQMTMRCIMGKPEIDSNRLFGMYVEDCSNVATDEEIAEMEGEDFAKTRLLLIW